MKRFLIIFVGISLHVLFSAESPLLYNYSYIFENNISLPILLSSSVAYSLAGVVASIIFLLPIIYLFNRDKKEKRFLKGFTFINISIAIYAGALIRGILFIIANF